MLSMEERENELLALMPPNKATAYKQMVHEVVKMEQKLDASEEMFESAGLVRPYENGGGQRGWQKSPILAAYHDLMADFRATFALVDEQLDDAKLSSDEWEEMHQHSRGKLRVVG